jgi:hypothetical protein
VEPEVDGDQSETALGDLDPATLAEYLGQLQANLDRALERAERFRARVKKLEAEREVLRERVEAARATTASPSRIERARARLRGSPQPESPDGAEPNAAPEAAPSEKPEPTPRRDLTVAAVLDPISRACFGPEFSIVDLRANTAPTTLAESETDLLFVESAFGGAEGSWAFKVAHFGRPHPAVHNLVAAARKEGIPTVFWNKEDPINYGMFIGTASLFEHVFTVDSNSVDRYRRDLGHSRVHVLPFAAQPAIHYPPSSDDERTGTVAFAGSYYARKHAQRRVQMEYIIDPARKFGLDIYDRMAGTEDERFTWPEKYRSHIEGSVAYPDMGDLYRSYRVFLNVNTVTDSPTMCARRIFELAATGTPIVSGPASAIDRMVPPGIVTVSENATTAADSILQLLERTELREEAAQGGPAWIADGNTYSDRTDAIIAAIL